ncbi:excitatory amino acid transporter 4-like [Ornithodoros turicata]|uniref:excitatory amino acid transporter 4-like n=1 Tax=Ornithodoros turicata TaxID=34597 RepID=UPI0031396E12
MSLSAGVQKAAQPVLTKSNQEGAIEKKHRGAASGPFVFQVPGILIIASGGIGVAAGFLIRAQYSDVSQRTIMYLELPGCLFQRILLLLVPLVTAMSVMVSTGQLGGRLLGWTVAYGCLYTLLTCCLSQTMAVGLVTLLRPGDHLQTLIATEALISVNASNRANLPDVFVAFARACFPTSIVTAFVFPWETTKQAESVSTETLQMPAPQTMTEMTSSELNLGFNSFGLVSFSIFLGLVLADREPDDALLLDTLEGATDLFLGCVHVITWFSPICVGFLAVSWVLKLPDWEFLIDHAGMYSVALCLGCTLHIILVLPLTYIIIVGDRRMPFLRRMLQPIAIGAGTASSTIAMPPLMESLEGEGTLDPRLVRILLPLLTLIRKDMVILYNSIFALSMAQASGVRLGIDDWLYFCVVSMATNVMALATPSESLDTIEALLVNSLKLPYVQPVRPILQVLDPAMTVIHVLGHSIGVSIVQSLLSREIQKASDVSTDTPSTQP